MAGHPCLGSGTCRYGDLHLTPPSRALAVVNVGPRRSLGRLTCLSNRLDRLLHARFLSMHIANSSPPNGRPSTPGHNHCVLFFLGRPAVLLGRYLRCTVSAESGKSCSARTSARTGEPAEAQSQSTTANVAPSFFDDDEDAGVGQWEPGTITLPPPPHREDEVSWFLVEGGDTRTQCTVFARPPAGLSAPSYPIPPQPPVLGSRICFDKSCPGHPWRFRLGIGS